MPASGKGCWVGKGAMLVLRGSMNVCVSEPEECTVYAALMNF